MATPVPSISEIIRIYGLTPTDIEDARNIREALKQADKREAAVAAFKEANAWPKILRFSHGTSWDNAQSILANGVREVVVGWVVAQNLEGPFLAVPKPLFATKGSFQSNCF